MHKNLSIFARFSGVSKCFLPRTGLVGAALRGIIVDLEPNFIQTYMKHVESFLNDSGLRTLPTMLEFRATDEVPFSSRG